MVNQPSANDLVLIGNCTKDGMVSVSPEEQGVPKALLVILKAKAPGVFTPWGLRIRAASV